jgi:hypothetical protein
LFGACRDTVIRHNSDVSIVSLQKESCGYTLQYTPCAFHSCSGSGAEHQGNVIVALNSLHFADNYALLAVAPLTTAGAAASVPTEAGFAAAVAAATLTLESVCPAVRTTTATLQRLALRGRPSPGPSDRMLTASSASVGVSVQAAAAAVNVWMLCGVRST